MSPDESTSTKAQPQPMLPAKVAARKARDYFVDITGYDGPISLEEVELTEDGERWLITLGFYDKFLDEWIREEKQFKSLEVDGRTGTVTAMRIRRV